MPRPKQSVKMSKENKLTSLHDSMGLHETTPTNTHRPVMSPVDVADDGTIGQNGQNERIIIRSHRH